jgi:hypothetical protein
VSSKRIADERFDAAISAFQDTLDSFCETVLPGGYRLGNKWICGDLQDGKGKSCAVFLDSGGFNDTNPSADHVKGSVLDLWTAIFGVTDIGEIIAGMEAWVEDWLRSTEAPPPRYGQPAQRHDRLPLNGPQVGPVLASVAIWRQPGEG